LPGSLYPESLTDTLKQAGPTNIDSAHSSTDTETFPLEQAETKTGNPVIETERLADFTTPGGKEKSKKTKGKSEEEAQLQSLYP
jgi:hypothetical protein